MSAQLKTLGGEDGGYESTERLMNKDDALEICKILGLQSSAVNNFEELPEPERLGAGKVNKFKQNEKLPFLDPRQEAESTGSLPSGSIPTNRTGSGMEKVPRYDLSNVLTQFRLSRYTFIPPFIDIYHRVGKQKLTPLIDDRTTRISFPDTAVSFSLTAVEVKERSAWAWHRTCMLYLKAAQTVESGGVRQRALGISTLGSGSTAELQRIVKELRAKAQKANSHAIKLSPKVLEEENVDPASWGTSFSTADQKYYTEMASNYERAQRVSMAEEYKGHALLYLCEAISLYLDWKESNPSMKNKFSSSQPSGLFQSPYFGGAGGIAKLWSEVANWVHHPDTLAWYKRRFREWWVRAVMARGHAEWLIEELKFKYSPDSKLPQRPIESWRLLPPPPVGCYTEDCVIRTILNVAHPGPNMSVFHEDDPYFTEYTKAQVEGREFMWTMYGEGNYNFGPGAPDSVFLGKAKTGWAREFLGLYPMDSSIMSIQTGYYERYCRQGLADFLPEGSSDYEKALAICADDMILEWEQQRYISIFTLPDSMGANILADLELDVLQLVSVRKKLTEAEAKKYGFYVHLYETIKHHFKRISHISSFEELKNMEISPILVFLARAEQILKPMIQPWYHVSVFYRFTDGIPMILLGDLDGTMLLTMEMAREFFVAKPVHVIIARERLKSIHHTLERLRASLLKGDPLDEEEWLYLNCFREYLETGDENRLPFVRSGIQRDRERTVSKFRRDNIYKCDGQCGCAFDNLERKEVEREEFRKSSRPQAIQERAKIKRAFAERDRNGKPPDSNIGQTSEKMLRDLFKTSYVSSNQLTKLQEGLSVEGRQLLSNDSRNQSALDIRSSRTVVAGTSSGAAKAKTPSSNTDRRFETSKAGKSNSPTSPEVISSPPENSNIPHKTPASEHRPSYPDPRRAQGSRKPNLLARLFQRLKPKSNKNNA